MNEDLKSFKPSYLESAVNQNGIIHKLNEKWTSTHHFWNASHSGLNDGLVVTDN